MIAKFTIPGPPKGKQRPRVTQYGGYAHAYTPQDTVVYENYVKLTYQQACRGIVFDGAVRAVITAYFPIPESVSKKKRQQMLNGEIKYTKKPDNDNIAKIVLDSLNQIAYKDDSQICELVIGKMYGEMPRVEVTLTDI